MMKLYKRVVLTLVIIFIFTMSAGFSNNTSKNNQQSLPFSIFLNLPNNQVDGVKSYFDLNVQPNSKQKIYVSIQNTSSNTISVKVKKANALNSPESGIVYLDSKKSDFATLTDSTFYMDQYLDIPDIITLKPKEVKKVEIKINVPDKKGVLLGGLLFELDNNIKEQLKNSKNDISSRASIKIVPAIAIQLNFPSKDKIVPLKIYKAESKVFNSGSYIGFQLSNENADIIKNVSYDYKILKSNTTIFKGKIQPFNVAPKAKVDILIPWDGKNYESGKYELVLQNSHNTITKVFHVQNEQVKQYAKLTNQKTSNPVLNVPVYIWVSLIILFILLLYVSYKLGKKKENGKEVV